MHPDSSVPGGEPSGRPSPVLAIDQRHLSGPFDIIGDVHGCVRELNRLFVALGYEPDPDTVWRSPEGRLPVFVGDLVDRGPENIAALDMVRQMMAHEAAYCVAGNHDLKCERYLAGEDLPLVYGLATTVAEFEQQPEDVRARARAFLASLPGHYIFDEGRLVIAHTGLPAALHGSEAPEVRRLAAYGEHADDVDPRDIEGRHPWIVRYRGPATVVYGHTPVLEVVWRGNTVGIDTGCVFGWRLTALRWPERDLVSVPAERIYARRRRPFLPESESMRSS